MTTIDECLRIERQLERSEEHLAESLDETNRLRAAHAKAVLEAAFPSHELAVFTRNWDEDAPKLHQLLSAKPHVSDIDFVEDGLRSLSLHQRYAHRIADDAIARMGAGADDEQVWRYLESSDAEHDGWHEFQLKLEPNATTGDDA